MRAAGALRSEPVASTRTPKIIGIQIAKLSSGRPVGMAGSAQDHRQQHEDADDHGEGVVVDEAGLQGADNGREPADQARRAVDESVDHRHVPALPQAAADETRSAGEKPVVEAIETVFVHQYRYQRAGLAPQYR